MTTSNSMMLRGQKRAYAYVPMELDSEQVYSDLSLCQYAATRALIILGVIWDRGDDNAMTISFMALNSADTYTAHCAQNIPDNTDCDETDPRSVARFILGSVEWEYQCQIVRDHDKIEVCDDCNFAQLEGRKVSFADIRPAVRAVFDAVWCEAERIAQPTDPNECEC